MYITCEQCSTIFRLDEKRLKPTGSKVRCCQCRSVFLAWPPAPQPESVPADGRDMEDATAQYAVPSTARRTEDTFDQELEGIDLAELDSILDQEGSDDLSASGEGRGDRSAQTATEELGELDESDLDMDFESELALDDDRPADSTPDAVEAPDEELDLDMDFELDAANSSDASELSADARLIEDELDMDFELGQDQEDQVDGRIDASDDGLGGDIDSVLDDFQDVLSEAEDGEVSEAAEETEEQFDLSDLEDALETSDDSGAAAEDISLGDIETTLDEPAAEEALAGGDDFDIDLSDLDMDLDEEEGSEALEEEATAADSDSDLGLSLDEDLALDEPAAPSGGAAVEDIGLGDIETALDEPAVEEALADGDEFDIDLSDLDMDLDEEEGSEALEEEATAADSDSDLGLSLDEDLALDEPAAPSGGAAAVEEASPTDEQEDEEVFDLSDLEGLMDLDEEEAEESAEEGESAELSLDDDLSLDIEKETAGGSGGLDDSQPADQADDLDLSDMGDLDSLLDEDQQAGEPEVEDQELTLATEDDAEPASAAKAAPMGDGLGLEGLDSLLDEAEESEDEPDSEELELSLDDEADASAAGGLSLDLSDEGETPEAEDLEFSLDSEFEEKTISASDGQEEDEELSGDDEELDLTDLEQMLENETLVPDMSPIGQESELDLTGKDEKFTDRAAETLGMGSGTELDLSEIEAAIDSAEEETDDGVEEDAELEFDLDSPADEETSDQEAAGDELDLELEMEGDSAAVEEGTADDDEAIDLSDLNLSLESEKSDEERDVVNAGDIELEFQIEDEMEPATIDSAETMPGAVATASATKTTVPAAGDTSLIEEAFADHPEVEKVSEKPAKEKKKKKKGSNAALIVILILVLLAAGVYFGYQYAVKNNIQIPFLNELIHPQPKDPSSTAMLTTLDINSKFIDNEKGGRIFVVTGKVRNGYSVPCNKIQLQGKLFSKGKVLAKTELAYAGVVIADPELASQEVAQIKQRLKTGGGQAAELVANPGQALPFMVVFSELPADLDEFAIELVNSTKVQ
jgi:pilus assembly protein FimV